MRNREAAGTGCVLRLFGAPEWSVQQAVEALPEKWKLTAQYRSRGAECLIALRAATAQGLEKGRRSLRACFAAELYGEGEQGLAFATVQALEEHRRLLVCSDAAAGALLEARLENLPGAEKIFDFGAVSYADAAVSARIAQSAAKHAAGQGEVPLALARVQATQRLVGAEFAVGCAEQQESRLLILGTKKGCWVRRVHPEDQPGLWLLDMVRRAACGLPQAEGTCWQHYRDPVAAAVPAEVPARTKRRPRHRLRAVLAVVLIAAVLVAAGWYLTGGDLTALPQKLQSLGAGRTPRSGAKLI